MRASNIHTIQRRGLFFCAQLGAVVGRAADESRFQVIPISFETHDEYEMFGKLVLPREEPPKGVVIYVQTAEGMTVDLKRPLGGGKTFKYFDLYRERLIGKGMGFFSYEGRGVHMGETPPRYESIDRAVFNTGTLENKVRDALSAIEATRAHPECRGAPLFLMGTSEGTLLAAETAARNPEAISGLILYSVLSENLSEAFKFIMSAGAFLVYREAFDSDDDGQITKEEFEKDPKKYRQQILRGAPFEALDGDNNGLILVDDITRLTKVYLDAVDTRDYEILQSWATTSAGVSVPDAWFEDHFEHAPIWSFLENLEMPVGIFHGGKDSNTPISAVRTLERKAKDAGKSNLQFHYFDDHDHSFNVTSYFLDGVLSAGHQAILAFVDELIAVKE